jgi:hypothetical protein
MWPRRFRPSCTLLRNERRESSHSERRFHERLLVGSVVHHTPRSSQDPLNPYLHRHTRVLQVEADRTSATWSRTAEYLHNKRDRCCILTSCSSPSVTSSSCVFCFSDAHLCGSGHQACLSSLRTPPVSLAARSRGGTTRVSFAAVPARGELCRGRYVKKSGGGAYETGAVHVCA